MGSDQCFIRLNVDEIKDLIYQKIGHRRASTYFDQLGKFLTSTRITKAEFDKLCIKTIGRENIRLHNRLLGSILRNASVAKSPPPPRKSRNNVESCFPCPPQKCRSKRFRERPSPLGPLGKPQSINTTNDESMSKRRRLPLSVEEGEEVENMPESPSVQSRSPITAPLGVSFNRSTKSVFRGKETCQSSGELPDSRTLMTRLAKRLEIEGIKLSPDSATLLNTGLNAFMSRLIEPCLSVPSSSRVTDRNNQQTRTRTVSMLDFRTAMELNPQVLGEEWPVQLEKICFRALEK